MHKILKIKHTVYCYTNNRPVIFLLKITNLTKESKWNFNIQLKMS